MARKRKNKAQIKTYLRGKGHSNSSANKLDGKASDVNGLLEIHGVSEDQYKVTGGKKQ